MFKGYKIKKLLSQLSLADSEDSRSELISQISETGKAAFPYVSEAFRNKQLTAMDGSVLLEELYDESLADDLLALTGDKYDVVRGVAKKLVLLKANSKIVKKLIENLESPNSYLKISSTELLREIKTQSCVLDLVSLFNRSGADVKLNVINILAVTGGDIAVKLLINALKSKEWRIRVRAVKNLGKMKSNKSVEPLMEILSEKDPQMKKSALDALMEIGDKKIAPSVLVLLKDEDLMIRQKAVDCIYEIGDSQIIPQVLELMQEKDVNIRRCAIEIINKMKDPKAGEALVRAMKDSDWWVRNVAMEALAEIKGENTVTILIAMLNDSDENIRRCAVEFFNRVSDPSAVEPLIGLLNDKDWWVREKTVSALGRLKDPRAIKPLTELINDEELHRTGPHLEVRVKDELTQTVQLVREEMLIGRSHECDIVLDEPYISRQHARIYFENDTYFIEDLKSEMGVTVNIKEISAKRALKNEDEIVLGSITITFLDPPSVEEPEQPSEVTTIHPGKTEATTALSTSRKYKLVLLSEGVW